MATPFRLKRSSVTGKRPALTDLQLGELAFNFYDGHLFAERDTGGVGIGTTIALLTPWKENFGGGSITYVGVVTANTYHGDQVIGNPAGGFKSGAFTISNTDHTKDSINELNFILGKLVPAAPDTFNGLSLSLTGTAGSRRLCTGFTPTNNTGGSAPSAGSIYTRNADSTITTNYINDVGPGDNGTVTGFVNAVGVGTTTLTTGTNNGTSDAVQIADNKDAENSTRNTGITSQFYQVYDVRLLNAASPDGYNKAFLTHGSATTGEVFWYEDPSTVSAPVISFSAITNPSSPELNYSSGIPHYENHANNAFTYVLTVTNASGDMYTQNTFLASYGQGSAFQNSGSKNYTNFAGGTNPPTRNYGVGTGVTTLITSIPRDLHTTVTSNHFTRYLASTPYGSHSNQGISFSTPMNIMGTTARPNQIDEDNISNTAGNGNNGTRVPAISATDNPSQSGASYSWGGGSAGSIATYEATVRGGVLRHDQTNYSSGYLPVGPNYSSGRNGAQYYQVQLITPNVSTFNISYTGNIAGCWVCMPDNSTWTTSLSNTNGWADMFNEYVGSGVPRNIDPGCAYGGVMDDNGGTFTCTLGTESSSNDTNNRILIRWRLAAGDSVTAMSFTST
tara:strand:+ start:7 stop:1863 length:1857 start_codon:yes stop_codon:yes gene_type:complete